MDIEFSDILELKKRLTPALKLRIRQLKQEKIDISVDDLWTYFANKYWKNAKNLTLADMVNDILNLKIEL